MVVTILAKMICTINKSRMQFRKRCPRVANKSSVTENSLFFILKIFNIYEKRFCSDNSLKYSELFLKIYPE